jgi:hypothetical protein
LLATRHPLPQGERETKSHRENENVYV